MPSSAPVSRTVSGNVKVNLKSFVTGNSSGHHANLFGNIPRAIQQHVVKSGRSSIVVPTYTKRFFQPVRYELPRGDENIHSSRRKIFARIFINRK